MENISDWHILDRSDLKTYPQVAARVQVQYTDGAQAEGACRGFFPSGKVLVDASIVQWRYIKDRKIR